MRKNNICLTVLKSSKYSKLSLSTSSIKIDQSESSHSPRHTRDIILLGQFYWAKTIIAAAHSTSTLGRQSSNETPPSPSSFPSWNSSVFATRHYGVIVSLQSKSLDSVLDYFTNEIWYRSTPLCFSIYIYPFVNLPSNRDQKPPSKNIKLWPLIWSTLR